MDDSFRPFRVGRVGSKRRQRMQVPPIRGYAGLVGCDKATPKPTGDGAIGADCVTQRPHR